MPAAILEIIKSQVITHWLQGLSRDAIARLNNISTGGVSNIIKEWTDELGKYEVDALRELAKSIKREGLSPAQCAIGSRIMKIFAEQGIDGEIAERFISDTYKKCNNLGVTPDRILSHIEDLAEFSEIVPLPKIENYINQKIVQEMVLNQTLQKLNSEISAIEQRKSELERSRDLVLEQTRRASEGMKSYLDLGRELDKHKISMTQDIPKFARLVRTIAEYGYEPKRVIAEFKDILYQEDKRRALKIAVDEDQKSLAKLSKEYSSVREAIAVHSHNLSLYDELANAGFGTSELRKLLNTILNITSSNGVNFWLAIDKFFKDIDTQYDAKLGFETEQERLIYQNERLKEEREKGLETLRIQPFVGPTIAGLLQRGLTETDILKFAEIYIDLSNRTFSEQDLAKGMIMTIDVMKSNHTRTTGDDNTTEILSKVRGELSKLDFP